MKKEKKKTKTTDDPDTTVKRVVMAGQLLGMKEDECFKAFMGAVNDAKANRMPADLVRTLVVYALAHGVTECNPIKCLEVAERHLQAIEDEFHSYKMAARTAQFKLKEYVAENKSKCAGGRCKCKARKGKCRPRPVCHVRPAT